MSLMLLSLAKVHIRTESDLAVLRVLGACSAARFLLACWGVHAVHAEYE